MPGKTILLVLDDTQLGDLLERSVLEPAGYQVFWVQEVEEAEGYFDASTIDTVIIDASMEGIEALNLAERWLEAHPALSMILLTSGHDETFKKQAYRLGVFDCLDLPLKPDHVLDAVRKGLERRDDLKSWAKKLSRRDTGILRQRVDLLETLGQVGRLVTASLDLDEVLKTIVDTAVNITKAEEGSLLILDQDSGDLYMRAARNFQDEFVQTFRLQTTDSLAGEVIRTGKPVILDKDSPQKIKTSYLVKTLMYVPLRARGRVIGVLGVDNRESKRTFNEQDLSLVSALADYAAIAIENARLYTNTEVERKKLAEVMSHIQDGVVVIDEDHKIILVNRIARGLFDLDSRDLEGEPFQHVFDDYLDLLDLVSNGHETFPYRDEIELGDERILDVQLNLIPNVGLTITAHDVTYFKKLDKIKSNFVHTVSHDLRSPLTSILGYIELLDRVGPLNERQEQFVNRVRTSVHNITELITDLLDLGRIESGLDKRREWVSLSDVIKYSRENYADQLKQKNLKLTLDISPDLPQIFGDAVRLRQVIDNLLGNAIRYTPEEGEISVIAREENEKVILQVSDTGYGIPPKDLPHIFDKFFRASNVVEDISGSGLGLAIVKSVVENHQGRVWADSIPGEGSTFTVVLPVEQQEQEQAE
jgi:two-component system NtrC family sensor kinase